MSSTPHVDGEVLSPPPSAPAHLSSQKSANVAAAASGFKATTAANDVTAIVPVQKLSSMKLLPKVEAKEHAQFKLDSALDLSPYVKLEYLPSHNFAFARLIDSAAAVEKAFLGTFRVIIIKF